MNFPDRHCSRSRLPLGARAEQWRSRGSTPHVVPYNGMGASPRRSRQINYSGFASTHTLRPTWAADRILPHPPSTVPPGRDRLLRPKPAFKNAGYSHWFRWNQPTPTNTRLGTRLMLASRLKACNKIARGNAPGNAVPFVSSPERAPQTTVPRHRFVLFEPISLFR